MMKLLCHTGRCFLRKAPSSLFEQPLRWDDGEPWEFCIAVEKDSSAKNYVMKGYLQRGAERVDLEKPSLLVLLVAGGFVFFEDRVSRLLDKGAFGWISILRKQKSLVVPIQEGDALIQELMSIPVLPRLSLPEELQYEEIRLTPQSFLVCFWCQALKIDKSFIVW